MWKMSCRLNFWRFLNGRNTFLKSLLRKLASLEQARLQLSNWGKWKEKFLWEEKLKVFFEVGRYIIPDCEVEDQIHFIASNYQSEENWLHDVCIFFFSFFEIFNQKPEFAECVYALRWLIIVNSYHHTSFRTFTIFPKISFRCSLESVKGLKKIESPFKSENTVSSIKKKVKKQTNRLTTDDISDLPTPPLTLTPHPILELWPDFFGLTSAILCALLGYKLYGTWYFDQYYHRLCGMHWARVGPYHRWICKRLETDFGSGNVRFKTNFGSANVLKRTSDLQTF